VSAARAAVGSRLLSSVNSHTHGRHLALTVAVLIPGLVFVVYPLWAILHQSFLGIDGQFSFENYTRYFTDPSFLRVIGNSFAVAIPATVVTLVIAYVFAYALHRSAIPLKRIWYLIAMVPLFAPSLVQALGLQLLLGRNGMVNRSLGTEFDIYGYWGIFISDTLYALPHAILILSAALSVADARLYESARMLGATEWRMFRTVTVPATRYGLVSAIFIVFTIVITDFGNPMVIGGDFSVLATEIYNQVSGQANFRLGAVIGIVLLVPAAIAVVVERRVARRQAAAVTAGAVPLVPQRQPGLDAALLGFVALVCLAILAVVGMVVYASFVRLWPYNLALTLANYDFDVQGGYEPFLTSLKMALMAAIVGLVMTTLAAYVAQNTRTVLGRILYFVSILPAAVPGMVLGLGYIFAFNDPANPVYVIYGSILMLAVNTIYHYHAQGFLTATTALKQIDATFNEASEMLGGGFLRTFWQVHLPIILPSLIGLGVFFFMRSMVTLSGVIFLVEPGTNLAAVSVLLLDDSGETTQAAAFSTLIMAFVIAVLVGFQIILRIAGFRDVRLIR
jgi:iron(III) transport system permease protein